MCLSKKQHGVLKGMIAGGLLTILVLIIGILLDPFHYVQSMTLLAKLAIAIQYGLLLALCLVVSIARLAKHRFFTPEDIDGSGLTNGSEKAKTLQSLLQNTLEQSVLAGFIYLAWAIIMPITWLSVIPLSALLFTLGRFLFFINYHKGASARALGFTLTFYPTVGMLFCMIIAIFLKMFN